MLKHLYYLKYMIRHKFWVTYYCFRDGLFLRGVKHDWSKFLPSEWFPYANYFYGPEGEKVRAAREETGGYYKPYDTGDEKFDFAWLLHQKRNDHHWQWWIIPKDDGGFKTMPMKEKAWREMICDWRGAGRAQGYGDNTPIWYKQNKENMIIHSFTRHQIEQKLVNIFGYDAMKDSLTM
jgi:hypothetical protein